MYRKDAKVFSAVHLLRSICTRGARIPLHKDWILGWSACPSRGFIVAG